MRGRFLAQLAWPCAVQDVLGFATAGRPALKPGHLARRSEPGVNSCCRPISGWNGGVFAQMWCRACEVPAIFANWLVASGTCILGLGTRGQIEG